MVMLFHVHVLQVPERHESSLTIRGYKGPGFCVHIFVAVKPFLSWEGFVALPASFGVILKRKLYPFCSVNVFNMSIELIGSLIPSVIKLATLKRFGPLGVKPAPVDIRHYLHTCTAIVDVSFHHLPDCLFVRCRCYSMADQIFRPIL